VTCALLTLLFVVDAPPSLTADADRVRRVDTARLGDALERAGLQVPGEVRVALIPESDPRARTVPDWIVGLAFGDRDIVILPERVLSYPYDSLESVVRHEVTHLALEAGAGGQPLPRWFHEGVAVSVDSGWSTPAQLRLLLAMLARPDIAALTRLFTSQSASETTQAYLLSAALMDDLRRRHGADLPGRIVRHVAGGVSFARAFQTETRETEDASAALAWAVYRTWTGWVPAVTSPSAAWTLILALALLAFAVQRRRRARRRRRWDDEEQWPASE
jgi:hypothetical protein